MKKKTIPEFRSNGRDLPATQGMLQDVRSEVKADIRGLRSETLAQFAQVDSRFSQVDSRFLTIEAKLERILSEVARIGVLVEEQNSKNRVVLEGLTGLWQRQERVETRMDDLEETVRSIVRGR